MARIWSRMFSLKQQKSQIQSTSCNVCVLCICLSPSLVTGNKRARNFRCRHIMLKLQNSKLFLWCFLPIFVLTLWWFLVWSWWTSILCIVGDLAGRWSVAVAVCVGDRWQVTCDRWNVTGDRWQVTGDRWHSLVVILALLSAQRFSPSCMQDIFWIFVVSLLLSLHAN